MDDETDELTSDQAERVWARVEAHIAAEGTTAPRDDEPRPHRTVVWARVAIILVVVGLAAAAIVELHRRPDDRETAQTLTMGALERQAEAAPQTHDPRPRYLAVEVHHPDGIELDESWIDASGRGCFRARPVTPVADPVAGPQCGEDMVRIGGLTPRQLDSVADAADPTQALEAALIRADELNTEGVRAELIATLLAWDDVDPTVREAGFRVLDRSGFAVTEATSGRIVLSGPGSEGPIRVVMDPSTTQVRSYASTTVPTSRTFVPGHQALPD